MTAVLEKKTRQHLRTERLRQAAPGRMVTVAALWPKTGANLGTLVRTCDAVGARLVVCNNHPGIRQALRRGDTLGSAQQAQLVSYTDDPLGWLAATSTWRIALELTHDATPLADLRQATVPTTLVVGHESQGIPDEAMRLCNQAVEIPMVGVGNSLNVAVAASLALYKLAGMT